MGRISGRKFGEKKKLKKSRKNEGEGDSLGGIREGLGKELGPDKALSTTPFAHAYGWAGGFTSPSAKSTSGIGGLVGRLGFGLGLVFGSGFGLHWLGLVWFLVWFGLVSFGLVLIWVVLG